MHVCVFRRCAYLSSPRELGGLAGKQQQTREEVYGTSECSQLYVDRINSKLFEVSSLLHLSVHNKA